MLIAGTHASYPTLNFFIKPPPRAQNTIDNTSDITLQEVVRERSERYPSLLI